MLTNITFTVYFSHSHVQNLLAASRIVPASAWHSRLAWHVVVSRLASLSSQLPGYHLPASAPAPRARIITSPSCSSVSRTSRSYGVGLLDLCHQVRLHLQLHERVGRRAAVSAVQRWIMVGSSRAGETHVAPPAARQKTRPRGLKASAMRSPATESPANRCRLGSRRSTQGRTSGLQLQRLSTGNAGRLQMSCVRPYQAGSGPAGPCSTPTAEHWSMKGSEAKENIHVGKRFITIFDTQQ